MFIEKWDNTLAGQYQQTATKPDKLFSILPTVMRLAGDVSGKTVLDVGCGDGFFTKPLAAMGAARVIGIDNSETQLKLAQVKNKEIFLQQGDIFHDALPKADVIVAPFVLNYASTVERLSDFLQRLYDALASNGRLVLVYDLPSGNNLERYGARKMIAREENGAELTIELYNEGKNICTLFGFYYKEETIKNFLSNIGFTNIMMHLPIIAEAGLNKFGKDFWNGYMENCELGYLTAQK